MESKQDFGRYVREKRTAAGLSQRALAELLYVTESAVSKWERGVSYPDITQIIPLCEALGVSEHELVTASDDWRQRKLEQEASAHRKLRALWLWGMGALYVAIVVGVLASTVAAGASLAQPLLALAVCLLCASVTHVPVLAQRERGMATLAASYVTMVASLFAGCALFGGDYYLVELAGITFTYAFAFGLPVLLWAAARRDAPALHHKGALYLGASTLLLFALVATVCLYDGSDVRLPLAVTVLTLLPVWAAFLALRYFPVPVPYRVASAVALVVAWGLFAQMLGTSLLSALA